MEYKTMERILKVVMLALISGAVATCGKLAKSLVEEGYVATDVSPIFYHVSLFLFGLTGLVMVVAFIKSIPAIKDEVNEVLNGRNIIQFLFD